MRLKKLPRMADHAVWLEAASPALGWKPGEYVAGYVEARAEIVGAALDNSLIGPTLLRVLDVKAYEGTADRNCWRLLNASASYGQRTSARPRVAERPQAAR